MRFVGEVVRNNAVEWISGAARHEPVKHACAALPLRSAAGQLWLKSYTVPRSTIRGATLTQREIDELLQRVHGRRKIRGQVVPVHHQKYHDCKA